MPTRFAPDAILARTNLSGALVNIQEDPDTPNGLWWTANSNSSPTTARVSFPNPARAPMVGAGLQEFRLWVRATGGGANPSLTVQVLEAGVVRATSAPFSIGSTSGQIVSFTWNASILTNPSGADVECGVAGSVAGIIILDPFDTVEYGAVEWNAELVAPPTRRLPGGGGQRVAGVATHGPSTGVASGGGGQRVVGTRSQGAVSGLGAGGELRSVGVRLQGSVSGMSAGGDLVTVGAKSEAVVQRVSAGGNLATTGQSSVGSCMPDAETQATPDQLANLVNLTGVVGDVDDDPFIAAADYLNAALFPNPVPLLPDIPPLSPTEADIRFATPSIVPAGNQTIIVRARTSFIDYADYLLPALVSPTMTLAVFDGATLIAAQTFTVPSSYPTGVTFAIDFDASLLVDPSGAGVEVRFEGVPEFLDVEPVGQVGWTVEPGAARWYVNAEACCTPVFNEQAAPDAVDNLVGLVGDVDEVREDPYGDDGQWLDAQQTIITIPGFGDINIPPLTPVEADVTFPTPVTTPSGRQAIIVRARTSFIDPVPFVGVSLEAAIAALLPPEMQLTVFDGATPVAAESYDVLSSYPDGYLFVIRFDSADLVDPTGAGVSLHFEGHPVIDTTETGIGELSLGWTVEPGSVRWYVNDAGCAVNPAIRGGGNQTVAGVTNRGCHDPGVYEADYNDIYAALGVCNVGAGGGGSTVTVGHVVAVGPESTMSAGGSTSTLGASARVGPPTSNPGGGGGQATVTGETVRQGGDAVLSGGGTPFRFAPKPPPPPPGDRLCPPGEPSGRLCPPGEPSGRLCDPSVPSSRLCQVT